MVSATSPTWWQLSSKSHSGTPASSRVLGRSRFDGTAWRGSRPLMKSTAHAASAGGAAAK
jgi:hypothetical protein